MDNYYQKYRKYKLKYMELKKNSFTNNLLWRRAEKHFLPGEVDIEPIKQAIINAPSSYGIQPFQVLLITNKEVREKLKSACYDQLQITECYALFIFCAIKNIEERIEQYVKETGFVEKKKYMLQYIENKSKVPDKVEWAKQQAYLALGFGLAAATELKIASCPMEGFIPEQVAKVLNLDSNLVPCVLLAVGRKKDDYELEKRFRFSDVIKYPPELR
jgi:nitroreductase